MGGVLVATFDLSKFCACSKRARLPVVMSFHLPGPAGAGEARLFTPQTPLERGPLPPNQQQVALPEAAPAECSSQYSESQHSSWPPQDQAALTAAEPAAGRCTWMFHQSRDYKEDCVQARMKPQHYKSPRKPGNAPYYHSKKFPQLAAHPCQHAQSASLLPSCDQQHQGASMTLGHHSAPPKDSPPAWMPQLHDAEGRPQFTEEGLRIIDISPFKDIVISPSLHVCAINYLSSSIFFLSLLYRRELKL